MANFLQDFLNLFMPKAPKPDQQLASTLPAPDLRLIKEIPTPTPAVLPPNLRLLKEIPAPELAPPILQNPLQYTVKPGDNLWNITKNDITGNGADYPALYEANKSVIGPNPNLIYPNQVLNIPLALTPKLPTLLPAPDTPSWGSFRKLEGTTPLPDIPARVQTPILGPNSQLRQHNPTLLENIENTLSGLKKAFVSGGENNVLIQKAADILGPKPDQVVYGSRPLPAPYQPQNTAEKIAAVIGDQAAELPLWLMADAAVAKGLSLAGKGIAKVAPELPALVSKLPSLLPKLGESATKGAATAALASLGESALAGDNQQQTLNRLGTLVPAGALGGPALTLGGEALGRVLNAAKRGLLLDNLVPKPLTNDLAPELSQLSALKPNLPEIPLSKPIGPLKIVTPEQQALAKLQDGMDIVKNYIQHNDVLAPYPPGTTLDQAFADIRAKTGVDLPGLTANLEKALSKPQALAERFSPERARLGRVAGVIPEPKDVRFSWPELKPKEIPILPTQSNLPPAGQRLIEFLNQEKNLKQIPSITKSESMTPAAQRLTQFLNEEKLKQTGKNIPLNAVDNVPLAANNLKVQPTGIKRLSFPDTVANGKITDPRLAKQIGQAELNYGSINNPDTLQVAKDFINQDKEAALRLVMSDQPATAESNAVAQLLIKEANDAGKYDQVIDIVEKTAQKSRTQGQAIQALSMWGKLTPEGVLRYANRLVKQAHEAGKIPESKVNEATAKSLVEQAKELQKLPEGSRERQVATAKLLDTVAAQVPASIRQKLGTLQTMAQLLNPKTAIRNVGGNLGFAGLENVSQTVGTGIDKAVGLITKERTTSLPSLKTQLSGGKTGWNLGLEDAVKGINTSGLTSQFDLKPTKTFRSGVLGKLETAMNVELRATDRAFYQAAYDDSLRSQMKAAGVSVPTEAMKEIADYDGLYRTFQDNNVISALFSGFKKLLNDPMHTLRLTDRTEPHAFGVGDFVIKYPKTPGNLLARGLDYSPAGFVKVVMDAAKPLMGKPFNQRAFVQSFSRAIVGSGALVGLGALLHRTGIISGTPESDYDAASLEKSVGLGQYQINASALKRFVLSGFNPDAAKLQKGDALVTYDWFQPQALPIAMGADIDKNGAKAQGIVGTVLNGLATGINTFADQPVMQGISTLFGQRDFSTGLTKIAQGIPASFVPTFFNQVKQLFDNQKRNTYSQNWLGKTANLAISKIPVLEKTLQPSYDGLGNPVQTYQNDSNNPFNVLVNPAFVTQYIPSKEAERALNAYNQTGETKQIPTIVPYSFTVSGQRFDLTPKQLTEMQQIVGQETKKGFDRIPSNANMDQQIKAMTDAIEKARLEGRKAILKELGVRYRQSGNTLKLLK